MTSTSALTRFRSILLGSCAALLGLLFVVVAVGRRLNFDEPLALRSGWLLWEGLEAAPDFYMPFTLMLGALGQLVVDPGTVFLLARLACLLAVIVSLAAVAHSSALVGGERSLFLVLVFGSGAFASHAFEFRYDTAILVGLLWSLLWLARAEGPRFALLGVTAAWLSMHHLKGIFFAAAVLAIASWVAWQRSDASRRTPHALRRLSFGFLGAWLVWLAISFALGFGADLVATYATFFELASEQPRAWPWQSLERYLVKDVVWWLIGLLGWLLWLRDRRESAPDLVRRSLVFAAATLAFLFVHPYPLPYLLAMCVPFVALPAARGFEARSRLLATLVALAVTLSALAPKSAYVRALNAPRTSEVASLRWLQQNAEPTDRVFDPSGLAYFLPPCLDEWYLDSLFSLRAERGWWMTALEDFPDPARPCTWLVNTYRASSSVPQRYGERLAAHFALVVPGIALANDDPRWAILAGDQANRRQIPSFWW